MKKLLLLPLFLLLLTPLLTAQLTYDSAHANVVTGTIRGMASYNDKLYISHGAVTNTNLTVLNSSLGVAYWETMPLPATVLAVDADYIYAYYAPANPDRIYRYENGNLSNSDFKEVIGLGSVLSGEVTSSGNLLIGTGEGVCEYNYPTNTIGDCTTFTDLEDSSNQILILTLIGSNYYVGFWNETLQIDSAYNIRQEELPVINGNLNDRYMSEVAGTYYAYTLGSNDLREYTTTGAVSSDYVFINDKYWDTTSQCINTGSEYSYIECSNPTFAEFTNTPATSTSQGSLQTLGVYCASLSEETTCEGTCVTTETTVNDSVYVTGSCSSGDSCTTECFTTGTAISTGTTTYRVCGNYDGDPCLEYGAVQTCPAGSFFSLSSSGYCSEYNYSSYNTTYLNSDWYVSINQISENIDYTEVDKVTLTDAYLTSLNFLSQFNPLTPQTDIYYRAQYLSDVYELQTELSAGTSQFGIVYPDLINASGYASVTCSHTESIIADSAAEESVNSSKTLATSLTGTVLTTSLSYQVENLTNVTYSVKRVAPSIDYSLELQHVSQTNLLVYSDSELIFNQTTPASIDYVNIRCDFDTSSYLRACYVQVTDTSSNSYEVFETPVYFNGTAAPVASSVSVVTTDEITLTGYSVTSTPQRNGFTSFTEGTYPFSCNLLDGDQVIRVYHNNGNLPSYLDFKDVYLQTDLGVLTSSQDATKTGLIELGGDQLTDTQRIVVSIILSIGLFILVIAISNKYEVGETATTLIGAVSGIAMFIFFTIIGWLPVSVAIVSFIIAGSIAGVFIRRQIVGA